MPRSCEVREVGTFSDWNKSNVVCYHVRLERDMGIRLGKPWYAVFRYFLKKISIKTGSCYRI